jgi:hypothetical protein
VEGAVATASTRIITKKGTEVPIDYRMLKRGERWRVYDDELLRKIRSRVEEIRP